MNLRPFEEMKNVAWNGQRLVRDKSKLRHLSLADILEWWYRFTAPPRVSENASLAQRELVRRGRLSSTILLGMLLFLLAALPVAIIGSDHSLLSILIPSLVISGLVLLLNRKGKLVTAGIVLVVGFELGYIFGLLITPNGLNVNDLPRFDLLVEPVLLAVSFFPPRSVYLVALGNSLFIWADLSFMPHQPALGKLLDASFYTIIETPIALQIIVAFVTFLWVVSAEQAIKRADRAELIVALEHDLAQQAHTISQQKYQLERSIQQIIETHRRVANGDYAARVPLNQTNVLWQVSGSLNNLLSRFQRLRQSEDEIQRLQARLQRMNKIEHDLIQTKDIVKYMRDSVLSAKLQGAPIRPMQTGTLLDPLLAELSGNYLIRLPSSQEKQRRSDEQVTPQSQTANGEMTKQAHTSREREEGQTDALILAMERLAKTRTFLDGEKNL